MERNVSPGSLLEIGIRKEDRNEQSSYLSCSVWTSDIIVFIDIVLILCSVLTMLLAMMMGKLLRKYIMQSNADLQVEKRTIYIYVYIYNHSRICGVFFYTIPLTFFELLKYRGLLCLAFQHCLYNIG